VNAHGYLARAKHRSAGSTRALHVALGLYLFLFAVVIPLLTPLRISAILDPAVVRNALLPILVLVIAVATGMRRLIVPKTWYHALLLPVFVMAALVGYGRLADVDTARYYLSHLFQLGSAYIMFGVGWSGFETVHHRFWKVGVIATLVSTYAATLITLVALQREAIDVIYTASYLFILVAAYGAHFSNRFAGLAILGTLVSNKRGVVLSLCGLFGQHIASGFISGEMARQKKLGEYLLRGLVFLMIVAAMLVFLITWAADPANQQLAVARAINVTYDRLASIVEFGAGSAGIDRITSGRSEEVRAALDTMTGFSWLFGSGAGWNTIWRQMVIQNVHVTPLSLAVVFGVPFAIATYAYLFHLIFSATARPVALDRLTTTERLAPLYLSGSVVHTFVAYNLFIDLLVFFFAGVLARSLRERRPARIRHPAPPRRGSGVSGIGANVPPSTG
jgi:hypothetical protein